MPYLTMQYMISHCTIFIYSHMSCAMKKNSLQDRTEFDLTYCTFKSEINDQARYKPAQQTEKNVEWGVKNNTVDTNQSTQTK